MKKQRNTAQKKIIMEALEMADHPTATELYESVHAENPRISKATVFRVLSQYAENGEIRRLHMSGSDDRFDAGLKPHAHLRCAFCGKIQDVMFPELAPVLSLRSFNGCKVYSAEVDFLMCCPECGAAGAEQHNAIDAEICRN